MEIKSIFRPASPARLTLISVEPDQSKPVITEAPAAPADPLALLAESVVQVRQAVAAYVAANLDLARARLREIVLHTVFKLALVLLAAAVCLTAVILLLRGMVGAAAALFHMPEWGGELLVGALALAGVGLAVRGLVLSRRRSRLADLLSRVSDPQENEAPDVSAPH